MSTKINDVYTTGDTLTIGVGHKPDTVLIEAKDSQSQREIEADNLVSRADFLAAVEAELGVIILDPTNDSPVTEIDENYSTTDFLVGGETFSKSLDPAMARFQALRWATAARWIAAQPKIDPAQRDALSGLILDADVASTLSGTQIELLAIALLKSGKVEMKNV
jgi:hypothetical protein